MFHGVLHRSLGYAKQSTVQPLDLLNKYQLLYILQMKQLERSCGKWYYKNFYIVTKYWLKQSSPLKLMNVLLGDKSFNRHNINLTSISSLRYPEVRQCSFTMKIIQKKIVVNWTFHLVQFLTRVKHLIECWKSWFLKQNLMQLSHKLIN